MQNERFEILAKTWDSKPRRVKGAMSFASKVKEFLPKDISNFDVLDYGCGTGLVSFCFSNDVKSIDGLDNSNSMIEVYNQKAKDIGLNNIQGYVHNINTQELQENKYDLIVTNMTMHHIKDPEDFINKLSFALKPNAYLAIADLTNEDGKFHSDNTGVEHFGFDFKKIEQYFKNNNLKNINTDLFETINKPHNSYDVHYIIGQK
jgi:2-polyprenyl-3-methyl-5-hydroxy-6-metoxy-1,4-benzoquinol methylase